MDMFVSPLSTASKLLSINYCYGENRTGNSTAMNLYRKHEGVYTYQNVLLLLHSFYIKFGKTINW